MTRRGKPEPVAGGPKYTYLPSYRAVRREGQIRRAIDDRVNAFTRAVDDFERMIAGPTYDAAVKYKLKLMTRQLRHRLLKHARQIERLEVELVHMKAAVKRRKSPPGYGAKHSLAAAWPEEGWHESVSVPIVWWSVHAKSLQRADNTSPVRCMDAVNNGILERREVPDGRPLYRLTEEGRRVKAEALGMREIAS